MKVVYKGLSEPLLKPGKIYWAVLDSDAKGEYYNLHDVISGIELDWCELYEVDILANIREQRINEILNDETF